MAKKPGQKFKRLKNEKSLQHETKRRDIRPKVFFKKGAFKNFTKFPGKRLCQSLFFNKVETLLDFAN